MSELKLCKGCKYYLKSIIVYNIYNFSCLKTKKDILTFDGNDSNVCTSCGITRGDESLCGHQAKWFQPREEKK